MAMPKANQCVPCLYPQHMPHCHLNTATKPSTISTYTHHRRHLKFDLKRILRTHLSIMHKAMTDVHKCDFYAQKSEPMLAFFAEVTCKVSAPHRRLVWCTLVSRMFQLQVMIHGCSSLGLDIQSTFSRLIFRQQFTFPFGHHS